MRAGGFFVILKLMHKRTLTFLALAVLGFTFGAGYLTRPPAAAPARGAAPPPATPGARRAQPAPRPPAGSTEERGKIQARAPEVALTAEARDKLIDELNAAAATYNPAQLPSLERFLHHSDEEVRSAAIDAILVLGDASGAPLLRSAAMDASPKDAEAMLKGAAYLELPSAQMSELIKQRKDIGPARKAKDGQ